MRIASQYCRLGDLVKLLLKLLFFFVPGTQKSISDHNEPKTGSHDNSTHQSISFKSFNLFIFKTSILIAGTIQNILCSRSV